MAESPDTPPDQIRIECSKTLRIIAADLRMAGDVQQVELTEDGVTPQFLTLADDLWLIALRLDPDGTWADPRESPDIPSEAEMFMAWDKAVHERDELRAEVERLRADNQDLTADNAHLRERIRLMTRMSK